MKTKHIKKEKVMKRYLSILLVAGLSLISNLSVGQEIVVGNGKKTIIIDLNSKDANQEWRIQRLERAVRDLQEQVWQLSLKPINQDLHVCTYKAFMETYTSQKHNLEYDADEEALNKCKEDNHEMHCRKVQCRKIN